MLKALLPESLNVAMHWHLGGFWLFCGGDGLVLPPALVSALRTDGGVFLNATHSAWTSMIPVKGLQLPHPYASRWSHIKEALMGPPLARRAWDSPGQEQGPGSCWSQEVSLP